MATRFEPLPPYPAAIAAAILASSPVTRLALTSTNEPLRERAAETLAGEIADRLECERDQLSLAL